MDMLIIQRSFAVLAMAASLQSSALAGAPMEQEQYDRYVDMLYWGYMVPNAVTETCSAVYPQLSKEMKKNLAKWKLHNDERISEVTLQWQALVTRSPLMKIGHAQVGRQHDMDLRVSAFPEDIISSVGGKGSSGAWKSCAKFSLGALGRFELDPLAGFENLLIHFALCNTTQLCHGLQRSKY